MAVANRLVREVVVPRMREVLMRPGRVRRIPLGLAEGLRFEVDPADAVHLYLGTAEVEIARHIRRLARPGCHCFDIGGHNAYYAMILARLTGEEVVSFDFTTEAIERMIRNLALNPSVAPLVSLQQAYIAHESNPTVNSSTLDAIVATQGLRPPDFIKIDVEGAEASVLRGARNVLEHRPHLVIETHGREVEQECLHLLAGLHYSLTVVGQRRWFREHRIPHNRWVIAQAATS